MIWNLKAFGELSTDEVYDILKLREEIFIVEQQCAYEDCDGKDRRAYHLFLRDNDKIVAYLRILEKNVSYSEISIGRVVVDNEYRRKGIAREMMLKAIKFIREELCEQEIRISAQSYLIDFYKSFGFKEVSEIYMEDNIPHIEMLYKA